MSKHVAGGLVCDPPLCTPTYHPPKKGSQWVTHRSLALSLSSTCGKTPLSSGHNPKRQAGSGRRCCSTNLGGRASREQFCPKAPRPTRTLTGSALAFIPCPSRASQGAGQALMSLCPQCGSTQMAEVPSPQLFSILLSELGESMKAYKARSSSYITLTDRLKFKSRCLFLHQLTH